MLGEGADPVHGPVERPGAADPVVVLRPPAVQTHPDVERIVRRIGDGAQLPAGELIEKQPVRQDGRRPLAKRRLQDGEDLAVQERLPSREVVLAHAEALRLVQVGVHLLKRHHPVAAVVGGAGDEAVRAAKIAQSPGHVEPDGVQAGHLDLRPGITAPAGLLWTVHPRAAGTRSPPGGRTAGAAAPALFGLWPSRATSRSRRGSPARAANTVRICSSPARIKNVELRP